MTAPTFRYAALMTGITTLLCIGGYELYLRSLGHSISYDDSESLFADKYRHIYDPTDAVTVFTGSSRIKYDIHTSVWQEQTGEMPIQLANVGSTPVPVLKKLAADPLFKGKLILDVTEGLFFDLSGRGAKRPNKCLKYAEEETPAQRFGFHLNTALESSLVFLDKDNFALSGLLDRLPVPPRPGKMSFPIYPVEFQYVNFDRQNIMTDRFVDQDTAGVKQMQGVWVGLAQMGAKAPPTPPEKIDSFLQDIKYHTDAIRNRGGQVVFIRPPSSGPIWQGEQMGFPRAQYWDKLLAITGCPGIHFEDYPAMKSLPCTEFSHLRISDGILYTKAIIQVLQEEFGWQFRKSR